MCANFSSGWTDVTARQTSRLKHFRHVPSACARPQVVPVDPQVYRDSCRVPWIRELNAKGSQIRFVVSFSLRQARRFEAGFREPRPLAARCRSKAPLPISTPVEMRQRPPVEYPQRPDRWHDLTLDCEQDMEGAVSEGRCSSSPRIRLPAVFPFRHEQSYGNDVRSLTSVGINSDTVGWIGTARSKTV